jgi:hypothetical protein
MGEDSREIKQPDVLEVLDNVLSAALKEVRRARALTPAPLPSGSADGKRTSQPRLCEDVLKEAGRPLHVSALVQALRDRGVEANRDSLVSALTKRLAPQGAFVRTAANTFGLVGRDTPEET